MQDPWTRRREILQQAISRCLEEERTDSSALVREQVAATQPADYEAAAVACLAASEAVGSSPEAATQGAVAMALLSQMVLVFTGLENRRGSSSLSTAWGMPRTLNAGDAFFALAQHSLLSRTEELNAETRLQSARILDRCGRDLMEALHAAADGEDLDLVRERVLVPVALALGGLLGGADAGKWQRLQQLGRDWATMPPDEMAHKLASDPRSWLA